MSETINAAAPLTIKTIGQMGRFLPMLSNQAWLFSAHHIASYMSTRTASFAGGDENDVALMAAGRLDWLLGETRSTLSNKFTEREIMALLNCYQGEPFFPGQFKDMAGDICDDAGVEVDEWETSGLAPLIRKLIALTPAQAVTLADALEQAWYSGSGEGPTNYLKNIGIELL